MGDYADRSTKDIQLSVNMIHKAGMRGLSFSASILIGTKKIGTTKIGTTKIRTTKR